MGQPECHVDTAHQQWQAAFSSWTTTTMAAVSVAGKDTRILVFDRDCRSLPRKIPSFFLTYYPET